MSDDNNNIITGKIYPSLDEQNNNKPQNRYQLTENHHSIKTQSYKNVNYNANNKNNITEYSNKNNKPNLYINSSKIPKKRFLSTVKISNDTSTQLNNNNYETNYALNKISNIRYVNDSNKHISKINYIRSPDIEFNSHEKNRKDILKNNNGERNEECICDKNSKCTCGKRVYNLLLNEKEKKGIQIKIIMILIKNGK